MNMFKGQVALVTGAGRGLGRAYALWLAKAGAKVVVSNRSKPGRDSVAEAVVEEIRAAGGEAIADENAVENEQGAKEMVTTAIKAFGRLDILICNAGVTEISPLLDMDIDQLRMVMDVNFYGTLLPMRAALKEMSSAGYGRIVVTASGAAYYPIPGTAAYAASKAALIGLVRTTAAEVADKDIKINIISPIAYTPMSYGHMSESLGELFSTDNVTPVVGWLSSPACDRSGTILTVGGGKVSRVRIVETPGQPVHERKISDIWPDLESLDGAREWASGMDTANGLIAEFQAFQEGRIN